ncbi:uncharacterized protein [Rutidosis leptorrhynchoides]|uniref:uncharacterized protein n=1 Tax=Rutidosis leptorrhynchoides TaxID=125765 RepID=UPI003A99E680
MQNTNQMWLVEFFVLKVRALKDDIKKRSFFGKVVADMHVIEFQKRGLPHVHMVIWLGKDFETKLPQIADDIIMTEILDPKIDPSGYLAVCKNMIHGPCGPGHSFSPCMVDGKCSKSFPKAYCSATTKDQNGSIVHQRGNIGIHAEKNVFLDHRYVVPFNRDLVVKYQAHINLQICTDGNLMKYLFKYLHKGPDRAKVQILKQPQHSSQDTTPSSQHPNSSNTHTSSKDPIPVLHGISQTKDEILAYLDCRYLSAYEAVWRIFEFPIHERNPPVQRLAVHLPGHNLVSYRDGVPIRILQNPKVGKTTLNEWMETNKIYPEARGLTYQEFPSGWVWNSSDRK